MIRMVLILLFLPTLVAAQAVTIRSGEHDTFSRLVLSIGVGTQWEIEQSGNTIILQLEDAPAGFDVTGVFDRIPRDRISNIAQVGPDSLRLTLDCPCESDAFLWRPGQLVLDVIDSTGADLAPPAVRPTEENQPAPLIALAPTPTPTIVPSVLPSILVLPRPEAFVTPAAPAPVQTSPMEIDLTATETALAEGIARAASQGFLDPSLTQTETVEPAQSDDPVQAEVVVPDAPVSDGRPGVGISTAMDRDLALLGAAIGQSLEQQCLPADLFQIDKWGNDESFHAQIAALAEDLAGEFGEEPLEAQETLARLYVHFGFGVEARLVLAADTASSRSRRVLFELAGIVDDYDGPYPVIASQAGCPTLAGLWSFLINPMRLDEETRNQLMQQFFTLPQPLRGQISSRLARQFVEIGESDAAARLLSSADLTDAGSTHEVASARAFVAEHNDDPAEAVAVLSEQANDNARTTPQSLIRLIELQLEQGLEPSEADLLLVSALRKEHQGTEVETKLADVEAMGRAAIGEFQVALDLIAGREDDTAESIVNETYMALTNQATAGVFLGFAYGETPDNLSADTENLIAARLIELGFPERAEIFLAGTTAREAASERRYLRAQAAIGSGDYTGVIEALLGIEDDRARALRARAYEGLGEHRAALAALSPEQSASSLTLQFRASAWERLTVEDDDVLSTFAQVVLDPVGNDAAETLADRRALLSQSQESRRAVESLLLRFDGTTTPQE